MAAAPAPRAAAPAAAPVAAPVAVEGGVSPKSRLTLTLVAWFVGTLGVHRFMVGKTGTAVGILLLSLIGWATSWLVFGFFLVGAAGIWAFVDFLMIVLGKFKDKEGLLIT
ncbi:MAG: NINE protein, partial [Candidatus Omnitrophica bacterium]|nr:NINE protein [Candidatus Omnitrophota bacterium]